ncbi:MAG: PEGA domain-containing protein [bacterium]|nr:PEGA domain-containing protein [bacterium]
MAIMNIWLRRTYFLFSVLVFAVIATLLIIYATGWRYDINTKSLGKVGALSVNSQPNGANVYLNGKISKEKTPISTNDLIADEYRLSIWKDGYYDWQQTINIEETKTTFIPHVYLIKKQNLDNLYLTSKMKYYKLSNDRKLIAYQTENNLIIYNLESDKQIFNNSITDDITNFYWNNNNESIIFENNNGFYLLNINEDNFSSLNKSFQITPTHVFWSNNEPNIIYSSQDNDLYRINKYQNTKELIFSDKHIIHQYGDYFFVLDNSNILSVIDAEESTINELDLDINHSLKFSDPINGFLPIIDINNSTGYYFDLENLIFISITENIDSIDYTDSNNLLYTNSHEIWNINSQENAKELIIRTSEYINNAYWLINGQYIIYTTDNNQIKISEINRPTNNTYEIDHQMINNLERGYEDNIFFLINESGIYILEF